MQNMNPERYSSPRNFNANTQEERLRWAMRNVVPTKAVAAPTAISGLGTDVGTSLAIEGFEDEHIANQVRWGQYRVPGILMLDFEPVLAPQSTSGHQLLADIFETLWSSISIYYTGADRIQPNDMAILAMEQLLIDTWVEVFKKGLDVLQIASSGQNDYLDSYMFYNALGFDPDNYDDDKKNWKDLRDSFNVDVLGQMNSCHRIRDVFPGESRWSSLVKEWYKDESIDSTYVQVYGFRPRSFYRLILANHEGVYRWELTRSERPTSMAQLLDWLKTEVKAAYYDSSAVLVRNVYIAFLERNRNNVQGINIQQNNYELYPEGVRPTRLTYDWNMLIAIHNATIMYGLRAFDCVQYPETGRLVQTFAFDETAYSWKWFTTPKLVNLPNFNASDEDFINATQWTVAAGRNTYTASGSIEPEVLGIDVLVDARIYRYNKWGDRPRNISNIPVYQFMLVSVGGPDATVINTSALMGIAASTTFNMAPLSYIATLPGSYTDDTPAMISEVIGELDCLYKADAHALLPLKKQLVYNFWGYPLKLASGEGSFTLENKQESQTVSEGGLAVNPGSGK